MEEWKRRLIELGQEEREREDAHAQSVNRARHFITAVVIPAIDQVAEGCQLAGRSSRRSVPTSDVVSLAVTRNNQPELTFQIEAETADSVYLRVRNDRGYGDRTLYSGSLLPDGKTVDDLTVERVRDTVLRQLERRLKCEM
jgi:hypothetical protein